MYCVIYSRTPVSPGDGRGQTYALTSLTKCSIALVCDVRAKLARQLSATANSFARTTMRLSRMPIVLV